MAQGCEVDAEREAIFMGDAFARLKAAAVQAAPVLLDREATVAKACRLIEEAGDYGAQVIGFPESYIPAHPYWYDFYVTTDPICSRLNVELFKNSIVVPSPATEALGRAARRAGAYVVMGCAEKDAGSFGTIYNTQLIFGPDGTLLGRHRKLIPTASERLIHCGGDGSTLLTYPTPFGGLSGLICGENINSLARTALLLEGEVVHVASWPAFATRGYERQFHTIDVRMRYYAFEGRIFVISVAAVWTEEMKDVLELDAAARARFFGEGGHSGILNPIGDYIAGPQDGGEAILYADLDLEDVARGKIVHDVTGHYQRFDIFSLRVNRQPSGRQTAAVSGALQPSAPGSVEETEARPAVDMPELAAGRRGAP
ncbi:MAG: carbon-nitrogen hydrolase family protein [Acidobacteria bacterium]|nr:carbon-nitrogen hydrolase family protein [Acidobacteriota bacterium]